MTIDLNIFEREIPERILEEAEVLNTVVSDFHLQELERNLWTAAFDADGEHYEVEVLLRGQRIVNHSCDCGRDRICAHLGVALFKLRHALSSKPDRRPKSTASRPGKPFTVSRILNHIGHDDLMTFLKKYAHSHPRFARELKLNFAHRIEVSDIENKYRGILNEFGGKPFSNNKKLTFRQLKDMISACDHLLDTAEKLIALQNFRETIGILCALPFYMTKMHQLNTGGFDGLEPVESRWHQIAATILNQQLAPDLIHDFLDFCTGWFENESYHYQGPNNLFSMLLEKSSSLDKWLQIQEDRLSHPSGKIEFFLILLDKKSLQRAAQFYSSHMADSVFAKGSIRQLQLQDVENVDRVMTDLIEHLPEAARKTAVKSIDTTSLRGCDRLVHLLCRFAVATNDPFFLQEIKALDPSGWKNHINELAITLSNEDEFHPLLGHVFSMLEDHSALVHWLQEGDVDLLLKYSGPLLNEPDSSVISLYRSKLTDYLASHIGPKALEKCRHVAAFLKRHRAELVLEAVAELYQSHYPERPKLIRDLREVDI